MNIYKPLGPNVPQTSKVNAKHLVLDLLLALGEKALTAREAVSAAALFGITENSLRVTLARLCAAKLIEATERGAYRLGYAATRLAGDVASWRTVEQRLRPWDGDYVVVHSAALPRSDRPALRQRERALQMLGFRELQHGLHVRPNNLEHDLDAVRQRLYTLGLDRDAAVFLGSGFDTTQQQALTQLWDGAALNASYQTQRIELLAWLERSDQLSTARAARESFLLGGQAIRHIVYDPLLPEPLVDTAQRHAFIRAVHQFDADGRAIWARFFESIAPTSSAKANHAPRATAQAVHCPSPSPQEMP
ncbi:PaaX family transcriptional regulator C-terminal domain-containing protein [Rhodoferax sp.]|uniref:PaaX family transcriptional regulator C-terminal domain-containing protein n=1 Tax=Rhodoferax sp. TaxID=50421 RepID=UPI002750B4B8|nr:PaaX family transcriptional regulator C-terminal domain-containing protein [Rhodoferax sp.]